MISGVKRLVFGCVLFAASLTHAQTTETQSKYPVLKVDCDPTSITVGDHVTLRVSATVPELQRLLIRDPFAVKEPTSWTLVQKPVVSEEKIGASEWQRKVEYKLATFELGAVELPKIEVSYQPPGGGEAIVKGLPEQTVQVNSVLEGDPARAPLNDIKGPVAIPIPRAIKWGAAILAAAVAAALAFFIWSRLRKKIGALIRPEVTPDEWALQQIEACERERLIEHKKLKELYTRLTDTLRHYLGRGYNIKAIDMTTGELLSRLEEAEDEQRPEHRQEFRNARLRLAELLDEADLVKFAQFLPEASRSRQALDKAREVVRLTRYRFAPEPEEANEVEHSQKTPPPPPVPSRGAGEASTAGGARL